jgi:U32 family peptidase
MNKPELLAPAGNLNKLKIAFRYGADAVYVGGTVFGLRKYADNFTDAELCAGIAWANRLGKKVYLVLNGFAQNEDVAEIIPHLKNLQDKIRPHAFIISDIGVAHLAKLYTDIPIHISTQASVTNTYGVAYWKDIVGATRVILAREVSLSVCNAISEVMEVETFVHGAMCASYSGKCVISNYASGRDSNRGGCVQSCRHNYEVLDPKTHETRFNSYIMNAKDLSGIAYVGDAIRANVGSLKIEGRMKSEQYVATTTAVYRDVIDYFYDRLTGVRLDEDPFPFLQKAQLDLESVSHRPFSHGGLGDRMDGDSIRYESSGYTKTSDYIGSILHSDASGHILQSRQTWQAGARLEAFQPGRGVVSFQIQPRDMENRPIQTVNPNSLVWLPSELSLAPLDVIRAPH